MKKEQIRINSILLLSSLLFSVVIVGITLIIFSDAVLKREIEYIVAVVSLFLFVTMFLGLYYSAQITYQKIDTSKAFERLNFEWIDVGGIEFDESIIGGLLAWVLATVLTSILVYLFSIFVWGSIILLIAIFNWVFYRGFRLVLKKRNVCAGSFFKSMAFSLLYTFLYTGWVFIVLEVISKLI